VVLRRLTYVVAVALVVGAASCGSSGANAVHHRVQRAEPNGETIDFSQPPDILDLAKESGVSAAAASLPYAPDVPTSLGMPQSIMVASYTRTLALIYQDPKLGRYWVEETVSQTSNTELQSMADCSTPAPDCDTDWFSTTLADGTPAIALPTPNTALIFLHGSMRFDILGPADTFTTQDAVHVANALGSAASTPSLSFQ
jgi:hypothetical protein